MKRNRLILFLVIASTGFGFGCDQKVGDLDVEDDVRTETVDADDSGETGVGDDVPPASCKSNQDCDDGIDCTDNSCLPSGECAFIPINLLCDQSNECKKVVCKSTVGCVDEEYTDSTCLPDDKCALSGSCNQGICQSIGEVSCNDGNFCTGDKFGVDSCDPDVGCEFKANTNECDDGSEYTDPDTCSDGVCKGELVDMACATQADCVTDDACLVLKCEEGKCVSAVDALCDDGVSCTTDTCDPVSGCKHVTKDGACGGGDFYCHPDFGCSDCKSEADCDDENPCTTDTCVDFTCVNTAAFENDPCDDSDPCSTDSFCDDGVCEALKFVDCSDSVDCSKDWCDPDAPDPNMVCFHDFPDGCEAAPAEGDESDKKEECGNNVDDDGDGSTDEAGAVGCTNFYADVDDDGYGKAGASCLCSANDPWTATKAGDCNDSDSSVNTGALEVCDDGIDNNCDGHVDENCAPANGGNDGDKFCELRISDAMYELYGWYTGAQCWDQNIDDSNVCHNAPKFVIYGSGTEIWANAKCYAGEPCNKADTTFGVGDTNWINGCTKSELVVLQNLFVQSEDCECEAKCKQITNAEAPDGDYGDPNLHCTVKQ